MLGVARAPERSGSFTSSIVHFASVLPRGHAGQRPRNWPRSGSAGSGPARANPPPRAQGGRRSDLCCSGRRMGPTSKPRSASDDALAPRARRWRRSPSYVDSRAARVNARLHDGARPSPSVRVAFDALPRRGPMRTHKASSQRECGEQQGLVRVGTQELTLVCHKTASTTRRTIHE